MKIRILSEPRVILSNPDGIHNYFGWPSVARLQDGTLAAVASGFRLMHVCPFGKAVMIRSADEGKTWSAPEILIDTPLDDRDSGVTPFGEKDVIVTSFNNTVEFQRGANPGDPYIQAYLDRVASLPDGEKLLGSTFVLSHDGGKTFGKVMLSPVTSPHGPIAMPDGTLLYVGRFFDGHYDGEKGRHIGAVRVTPDGECTVIGTIEDVSPALLSCEPHAVLLPDGKIVVHIRIEREGYFTLYQSVSHDGGVTFTRPVPLLPKRGGAPAHLLYHSSGVLLSVYGYREIPYGIRCMASTDGGETWDTGNEVAVGYPSGDLGYPASVELSDGSLYTVYYARAEESGPAMIWGVNWTFSL